MCAGDRNRCEDVGWNALETSMEDVITDVEEVLVRDYAQSEERAVIEIGLFIGIGASFAMMCIAAVCMLGTRRVLYGRQRSAALNVRARRAKYAKKAKAGYEDEEVDVSTQNSRNGTLGSTESLESESAGTEGAYRSDTESDDDGEAQEISAVAQKRARNRGSI
jgi:hypothetical protein